MTRTGFARLSEDGTGYILAGSLVAGLAAYAYQILGGRTLGARDFAPVSVLLTIHFLTFIVILLPIEQLVVRRLTLDHTNDGLPLRAWAVAAATVVGATLFAWVGVDRFLNGDRRFIVFTALTVTAHVGYAVGRGHLAGRRRFREYGLASAGANLLRLAVALAVLAVRPSASGLAIALVVGPFIVLAWHPFRHVAGHRSRLAAHQVASLAERGLLAGLILSSAASQALLLAGPVVAGVVGGGQVEVSVVFATFTLFRAPLTFGYNLIARILPPFTEMAARQERRELRAWARGIALAGGVLAALGLLGGYRIGPWLVEVAFGPGFRPDAWSAGLVGGGVVLAGAGLFIAQVLVAQGRAATLGVAWLIGLVAAGVALAMTGGDAVVRVSASFLAGEVFAVVALVAGAVRRPRPADVVIPGAAYALAKRTLDIGVSTVALLVGLPLLVLAVVAIKVNSRGPAFFRQERVGRDGRRFAMLKLRTMSAEGGEAIFVRHLEQLEAARLSDRPATIRIEGDPRVTRVGSWLRKSSLDEVPNLWNVLLGSMSLVGPRPLVPAEAELVGMDHPRFTVKPGVTGLAQVGGRDEIDIDERTRLDQEYVDGRSMRLDIKIMARTVLAVVRAASARG